MNKEAIYNVIERLQRYCRGYLEIGVHEKDGEAGGGWCEDGLIIQPYGGAVSLFATTCNEVDLRSLIEFEYLVEDLDRLNANGSGYAMICVPVEYEEDWYEPNGGVPQLVCKGGPYLLWGKSWLYNHEEGNDFVLLEAINLLKKVADGFYGSQEAESHAKELAKASSEKA